MCMEDRIKAAKKGLKRYNGTPCKVCGTTERLVSNGTCIKCAKRNTKTYRDKLRMLIEEAAKQNKK